MTNGEWMSPLRTVRYLSLVLRSGETPAVPGSKN